MAHPAAGAAYRTKDIVAEEYIDDEMEKYIKPRSSQEYPDPADPAEDSEMADVDVNTTLGALFVGGTVMTAYALATSFLSSRLYRGVGYGAFLQSNVTSSSTNSRMKVVF